MNADYSDLSTSDLAKQINDEYSVILDAERTNLQRALAVGEKLIALRPRIAPKHGDWQAKLKVCCPKLSYETQTYTFGLWRTSTSLKPTPQANL